MKVEDALHNLRNTVLIKKEDKKFQFIYATQLYGTVCSIFANFEATESGDNRVINKINFFAVNYKGPVSLGIESIGTPTLNTDTDFVDLKITLRADDTRVHSEIHSVATKLEIKENTFFRIERELKPMSDKFEDRTVKIEDRAFVNGKFDSEFFTKDGFFIRERTPDWDMLGPNDFLNPDPDGLPGTNCKIGVSTLTVG